MNDALSLWLQAFWKDQQVTPERLKYVLRIALSSAVTLIAMLVLQMPYLSLGLYIIFFVLRDSPLISFRVSAMMLFSAAIAVALELGVVILTDNNPMARVLSIAVVSFLCGLLIEACAVPFLFVGIGFIYCTLIAVWEINLPSGLLVKSSLRLIGTVAITLGSSVAVEYLFGARNPSDELRKQMAKRYRALEKLFQLYSEGNNGAEWLSAVTQVAQLAASGSTDMQELYEVIVDRGFDPGELEAGTRVKMTMLVQLLDLTAARISQPLEAPGEETKERCREIAATCRALATSGMSAHINKQPLRRQATAFASLDRIEETLRDIVVMPHEHLHPADRELAALPLRKVTFLRKEILTSRESRHFALKLSLCATLCYIIYFAVAWPGISTCCGTVLIVGLSNTGAMKQKFLYRILGSALGGILGLGVETIILPNVDTLTPVVLIVVFLSFLTSWIALGRRFGYIGMQMAFSFYLVAFAGPRAPTQLAPARDRLIGILIALAVMWLVFDQLWPVRTITMMRRALASVLCNAISIFEVSAECTDHELLRHRADDLRDQFGKTLATLQSLNDSVKYEFCVDRSRHIQEGETIFRAALAAAALFWNELTVLHSVDNMVLFHESELIEMRRRITMQLGIMEKDVREGRPVMRLSSLVDGASSALNNSRYGEYLLNLVSRFEELQAVALDLNASTSLYRAGGERCTT
jgi:multidrug resistance protein MdtO